MKPTREQSKRERAILVGVDFRRQQWIDHRSSLAELARLAESAALNVVGQVTQRLQRPSPATFIGTGKVERLRELVADERADVIAFDDELSPVQVRNLEEATGVRVIDRAVLILDIFARRARTRESKAQVELAQLNYLYPRLTRRWTHLEKQRGGIGFRGPGETQLEVDRRLVGRRIKRLKDVLKGIDRERTVQRNRRSDLFKVALVGYTNAGKSTLFNALTRADVWAENHLFSTLDATTRILAGHRGRRILLTDTIGFIHKLPAQLLASFRATLADIADADLLLHVVDSAMDNHREAMEVVEETLQAIDAGNIPRLLIRNKIDLCGEEAAVTVIPTDHDAACVAVSATERMGLAELTTRIETAAKHEPSDVRRVETRATQAAASMPMQD